MLLMDCFPLVLSCKINHFLKPVCSLMPPLFLEDSGNIPVIPQNRLGNNFLLLDQMPWNFKNGNITNHVEASKMCLSSFLRPGFSWRCNGAVYNSECTSRQTA